MDVKDENNGHRGSIRGPDGRYGLCPTISSDDCDADEIDLDDDKDELGLLFCCGERLVWRDESYVGVLEAHCHKCKSDYACDPGPMRFKGEDQDSEPGRLRDAF